MLFHHVVEFIEFLTNHPLITDWLLTHDFLSNMEHGEVFAALLGLSVVKYVAAVRMAEQSKEQPMMKVGKLSRITVFPVKSMRGVAVSEADCTAMGITSQHGELKDRIYMVGKQTYGQVNMVTGRQEPKMVTIIPSVSAGFLRLEAPGMDPIQVSELVGTGTGPAGRTVETEVWDQPIEAVDCGNDVADWLVKYIGTPGLRLLYSSDQSKTRQINERQTRWDKAARDEDKVAFQDGFPTMLMTNSSVADLNQRLSEPVAIDNFRPNFIVDNPNLPAFDEDDWDELRIGKDAVFRNIKPCSRCVFTTIDFEKGIKHPKMEPLRTLRSFRLIVPEFQQSPCMGINLITIKQGTVQVGDDVYVTKKPFRKSL